MITSSSGVRDFQAVQGPSDPFLRRSEIEGYQPVSRIGEIVINSFVDAYEFSSCAEVLTGEQITGDAGKGSTTYEQKPHFHEWASVLPGMICLARKQKTHIFRQYVAAETAVPVISCVAGLKKDEEDNYYFAGVARSKSVRTPDDGIGPQTDEFFTLALGGMVTCLNNSGNVIHAGELLEWTFLSQDQMANPSKRMKSGPRRVGIKIASISSDRIIGRALSFAKNGEPFDLLVKQ